MRTVIERISSLFSKKTRWGGTHLDGDVGQDLPQALVQGL